MADFNSIHTGNVIDTAVTATSAIPANTTHRGSDGKDHSDVVTNNAKVTNATHTGDVTGSTALTIGADKVNDTHIDFGTGANQVSTADVPEQTNLYYTDVRASANVTKEVLDTNGDVETVITDTDDKLPTSGAVLDHVASATLNNQTGTSYTLVLSDKGKVVTLSNASAITLTIPANASVAFPIGTQIPFVQIGAGQVTVAITTDTLSSVGGATKLTGQYSAGTLIKLTSTIWVLVGDITT